MSVSTVHLPKVLLALAGVLSAACDAEPPSGLDAAPADLAAVKQSTTENRMLFELNNQVWIMNDDGSNRVQLTQIGTNHSPTWAPDGKRVLFAAFAGCEFPPRPGEEAADEERDGQVRRNSDAPRLTDNATSQPHRPRRHGA